jgi:hypothetical protein
MTRFLSFLLVFACVMDTATATSISTARDSMPTPVKTRIGFDLGWESPYSAGMQLSMTIKEVIDLNAGVGLGLSGFKAGIGARVYPMPQNNWSPMVGAYLFATSGLGEVTLTSNNDEALYRIPSARAYAIQLGLRAKVDDDYFIICAGHSWAYKGGNSVYLDGSTSDNIEKVADIMGVGGFSFNLSYLIRLGRG